MTEPAHLVLQDGTVYEGESFGTPTTAYGEVVFTTSMTGYQEMLTDPSFAGQIVVPTYPLQGNYGINPGDVESCRIQVAGFVVRGHSPTDRVAKAQCARKAPIAAAGTSAQPRTKMRHSSASPIPPPRCDQIRSTSR